MASILALAGSTRKDSFNRKLIHTAVRLAEQQGAKVTLIELKDYELPLYQGDLEADSGVPDAAIELKKLFLAHQGILIAAPEYNGSITALLKNTIDWVSRPTSKLEGGNNGAAPYQGKVVGLMAASPGALGGLRGLVHVRQILTNLGCIVHPSQVAIGAAGQAFDADGQLKDDKQRQMVSDLVKQVNQTADKLAQSLV